MSNIIRGKHGTGWQPDLINMRPSSSGQNFLNSCYAHAELSSKHSVSINSRFVCLAYCANLNFCQFSLGAMLATKKFFRMDSRAVVVSDCATSFLFHVLHVIGLSPSKKMVGANASWHIAFMTNIHALWQLAVMQFVGVAMRGNSDFIGASAVPKFPITEFSLSGSPKPASVGLIDFRPKPFSIRTRERSHTFRTAKLTFAFANFICESQKIFSAITTLARNILAFIVWHCDSPYLFARNTGLRRGATIPRMKARWLSSQLQNELSAAR